MATYGNLILWLSAKIEKLKVSKNVSAKYAITGYKNVILEIRDVHSDDTLMTKKNIEVLEITDHMVNKFKWFLAHYKHINATPQKKTPSEQKTHLIINQLMKIKGIGPKKALQLISHGVTKISDLKIPKHNKLLDTGSKIFIKHNPVRISYNEIKKLESKLKSIKTKHQIVGSYRRKKEDSGDIDILIYDEKNTPNILSKFADSIKKKGIVLYTYSHGPEKMSTIAKLPGKLRKVKLDLFRVPAGEEAPFLLYSTGSGFFNKKMRLRAKTISCTNSQGEQCKYLLNQHGLYKIPTDGGKKEKVSIKTEQDIFKEIKMKYVNPENR